jgi:hypothetical protein
MPPNEIPIARSNVTMEVMARIVKVTARKNNCDVMIDFSNGLKKVLLTGGKQAKERVANAIWTIFSKNPNYSSSLLHLKFTNFVDHLRQK